MAKGLHFPKAFQGQILAVKQYLRDIVYGRWMPMVSSKLGDASRPTAFLGARSACKQTFRPKTLVHCICITVSVWRLFLSVTLNPASHMIYIQKILGKCSFWCKTHPAVGRARDISVFWWLVVTLRCTSCFMVWDYIIQRCWAWLLEYGFPTSDCVVYFVSELVLR